MTGADGDTGSGGTERIRVDLAGVPETLLWTLYYRAREAAAPRPVLRDPLAVQLVERIDYPFAERLGRGTRRAQWQGLRSRTFDDRIRLFLARRPGGTVVALGEGLETQFWRVDDGRVRWMGVDLPEVTQLRRQILPAHPRHRQVEGSALSGSWMDEVEPSPGILITAQGLLMYLARKQVHDLLIRCARRFPGAELAFDGVPRWTSRVTTRIADRPPQASARAMTPPPMPWAMDSREGAVLSALPGIAGVSRLHPPRGRGPLYGYALPVLDRIPVARSQVLSIWSVRFA